MMMGIIKMPMAKLPAMPAKPMPWSVDPPLVEPDDDHLIGEDAEQDGGHPRHDLCRRAQPVGEPGGRLGQEEAGDDADRDREQGGDAVDDGRPDAWRWRCPPISFGFVSEGNWGVVVKNSMLR